MKNCYMLTLVGKDALGIVANVTLNLSEANCNLGNTSMLRLGGYFSILMMLETEHNQQQLQHILSEVTQDHHLSLHIDPLETTAIQQIVPDIRVSLYGADSPGIVAKATHVLADAGLNITNLSSEKTGIGDHSIYILSISGEATQGYPRLERAVEQLNADNLDVSIDTMPLLVG